MLSTWEVIVYDGRVWFRTPGCFWDTREQAERAAAEITLAPTEVRATADLDTLGLPTAPPGTTCADGRPPRVRR